MSFLTSLAKTVGELSHEAKPEIRLAEHAFGKEAAHLSKVSKHVLPSIEVLGEELAPEHMRALTTRLDAFAEKQPNALRRLNKVVVGNYPAGPVRDAWRVRTSALGGSDWEAVTSHDWREIAIDAGSIMDRRTTSAPDLSWAVSERAADTSEFFDRILTHELGHHLHSEAMAGPMGMFEAGNVIRKNRGQYRKQLNSVYSGTNPQEFFAEAYAASVHEPRMMNEDLNAMVGQISTAAEEPRRPRPPSFLDNKDFSRLPNASMNRGPRHSSARSGLPVRSSATGRFR